MIVNKFSPSSLFISSLFVVPIDSFTAIDRYFASFVCGTYLLFTAILSINIFIGLISNALQTEAFSTVEARFLLERVEVILNYEWRLSKRKRSHLQEAIHRSCSPLILPWKEINFDAHGQSREEQQIKALLHFRQTMEKQNTQFDTFRIQMQQKLNDIETNLGKVQSMPRAIVPTPDIVIQKTPIHSRRPSTNLSSEQLNIPQVNSSAHQLVLFEEISRLRELLEEKLTGQTTRLPRASISSTIVDTVTPQRPTTIRQDEAQNLNERVTDLQLAVNRLHQDVNAIRQVVERMSPLSASLILGRTAGLK